MSELKAIETQYNGYRFRSRLEARWAVFLDAAGVPYKYEPEGYDLDGILYLPDFYLPKLECWFEVKGGKVTDEAAHKAYMLCRATRQTVLMAGDMFNENPHVWLWRWRYMDGMNIQAVVLRPDTVWAQCSECGTIVPARYQVDENDYVPMSSLGRCECTNERWEPLSDGMVTAYQAGRQARFEYGECG